MKALEFRRSIPRFLAVRALAGRLPGAATLPFAPLRFAEVPEPALPGPDWVRLRSRLAGICGSDLATVSCQGSYYFSGVTSFPFVLGHETVAEVSEAGPAAAGTGIARGDRVVIEPALGCTVRGIATRCAACAAGNQGNCINIDRGVLAAGVQTGYCRSTGGGWGESFIAHLSQLHKVPATLSDEDAVVIEPFACAIHAVLRARPAAGDQVLVLGAGSVGLLTLLALKRFAPGAKVSIAARHSHQRELAVKLGADQVLPSGRELRDAVIAATGARLHRAELGEPMVLGGVDATFDCIGSSRTLDEAIRLTRARGTVVVVGMPARLDRIEGTALWFKETRLLGAYAYGVEPVEVAGQPQRSFALAIAEAAREPGVLGALVTSCHRAQDYRTALARAFDTGRSGAVKTVFDWR